MQDRALIIFIKNKEKGKVKTRLAATVGDDAAMNIYEQLLDITKGVSQKMAATRYVYYSSHIESTDEWNVEHFNKKTQHGVDLGARMRHAFDETLQQHDYAVIIGSDCAALQSEILAEAFASLEQHDIVIGPALDGGYYLLGMKKQHNSLFENIEWSTDSVLKYTLAQAKTLNLSVHQLQALSDIDNENDWLRFLETK
jgi:rSAM/selenodomain-associated transferase 1